MRIAIVVSHLLAGGAENQLTLLANALVQRGIAVDFILLNGPDEPIYFDLSPQVGVLHLDAKRSSAGVVEAVRNGIWRVRLLIGALRRCNPDIVIAVLPEAMLHTALAARRLGIPFIASQRNNPAEDILDSRLQRLQALSFRATATVVFQTQRAKDAAPASYAARGAVIPNIVNQPQGAHPDHAAKTVVAVGRLTPTKGFDILIRAFAKVHDRFPEWRLKIYGEGTERAKLERLSGDLGLADSGAVVLPGVSTVPRAWLDGAAIFVLSSRTEGFPNVLCEAMAAGIPCVAADCNFGPSEIVRSGSNGLLVPKEDPSALAEAMSSLIARPDARKDLGEHAREIADLYATERVVEQWCALFERVTRRAD